MGVFNKCQKMTGLGGQSGVGEELETKGVGGGERADWGRVGESPLTHCFSFNPLPGQDK